MINEIIAFIVFFATLFAKIIYDYKLWLKGTKVNHGLELFIAAIPMCFVIYVASLHSNIFIAFMLVGSWFMFLFNGLYNLKRKFGWLFIGGKDDDDSVTEKFFRFVGPALTVIIQVGLVLTASVLFILKFK